MIMMMLLVMLMLMLARLFFDAAVLRPLQVSFNNFATYATLATLNEANGNVDARNIPGTLLAWLLTDGRRR